MQKESQNLTEKKDKVQKGKAGRPKKTDKQSITHLAPANFAGEDVFFELTYPLDFNINEEIFQRLEHYILIQEHSFYHLSKAVGVSVNYFANIRKKNSSMGSEIIARILYYYKDLSADWLLLGIGKMTRGTLHEHEAKMIIERNKEFGKLEKVVDKLNKQIRRLKFIAEENFQNLREEGTLGILPGAQTLPREKINKNNNDLNRLEGNIF